MPSLKRQNARSENLLMKALQELSRDKKAPHSIRLKALDRIAIILGKYSEKIIAPVDEPAIVPRTSPPPVGVDVDSQVQNMIDQLKSKVEESDADSIHKVG